MLKYFVVIWSEKKKILGIIGSCHKGRMMDIWVPVCCLFYVPEIDYVSLSVLSEILQPGYRFQ